MDNINPTVGNVITLTQPSTVNPQYNSNNATHNYNLTTVTV
jgi:hypothetical protein